MAVKGWITILGEEELFLHDSYGPFGFKWFYLFFCIKEKKSPTQKLWMPKESIWLAAVSIASLLLLEKTQPSSWAEVSAQWGFCDSSWVLKPRSANWRKTVAPNVVLWGEKAMNSSSGSCLLSRPCVGQCGGCSESRSLSKSHAIAELWEQIKQQTRKIWFPSKPSKKDLPI